MSIRVGSWRHEKVDHFHNLFSSIVKGCKVTQLLKENMASILSRSLISFMVVALQFSRPITATSLIVSTESGKPLSPHLHGLMFEVCSNSVDFAFSVILIGL